MAVTVTKKALLAGGPEARLYFTLVFNTNYPAGGDTVNFATLGPTGKAAPLYVQINGIAGFVYTYQGPAAGTADATNGRVQVYCNTAGGANAALGEHTTAAYVAGVTGDTITGCAVFVQFGATK